MTFPDLISALGVPVAVIAAAIPWFLDRSALAQLQRLDAIVSGASHRGGANSLLREARDKIAIKVGMRILPPRFNGLRALASVQIALALLYSVALLLEGAGPFGAGPVPDCGAVITIAFSVVSAGALVATRHFAVLRSTNRLREKHGIAADVPPDLSVRRPD